MTPPDLLDDVDDDPRCGVCGQPVEVCDCVRTRDGLRPVTTIDPEGLL